METDRQREERRYYNYISHISSSFHISLFRRERKGGRWEKEGGGREEGGGGRGRRVNGRVLGRRCLPHSCATGRREGKGQGERPLRGGETHPSPHTSLPKEEAPKGPPSWPPPHTLLSKRRASPMPVLYAAT